MFNKNMDIDECSVHAIELYGAGYDTVSTFRNKMIDPLMYFILLEEFTIEAITHTHVIFRITLNFTLGDTTLC